MISDTEIRKIIILGSCRDVESCKECPASSYHSGADKRGCGIIGSLPRTLTALANTRLKTYLKDKQFSTSGPFTAGAKVYDSTGREYLYAFPRKGDSDESLTHVVIGDGLTATILEKVYSSKPVEMTIPEAEAKLEETMKQPVKITTGLPTHKEIDDASAKLPPKAKKRNIKYYNQPMASDEVLYQILKRKSCQYISCGDCPARNSLWKKECCGVDHTNTYFTLTPLANRRIKSYLTGVYK